MKKLKLYIKTNEKIIKFDSTEMEEYNFHQNRSPILINDVDINKMVVSYNNLPLVNKILNISFFTKILRKLDLYVYSFPKWLNIKYNLMKIISFLLLPQYKTFFQRGSFYFLNSEIYFSRNIKKVFFWENIRNFVISKPKSFVSQNIIKYKNFLEGIFLFVEFPVILGILGGVPVSRNIREYRKYF